jgi:hypothetical protein
MSRSPSPSEPESGGMKVWMFIAIATITVLIALMIRSYTGEGVLDHMSNLFRDDSGTRIEVSDSCYYDFDSGDLICR